ncbi:MAG: sulfotransferase [Acidobacteriota bacterium]
MAESRVLVITGMHRSGTSLVASILQQAGVMLGEKLLRPNEGNPRGYFEDKELFDFHERLLHRLGESVMVRHPATLGPPDGEADREVRQLIAARSEQPLWGFKDPRTALFLDFWDQRLTDARYVFVYRHPIDVLLSLLRRGVDFDVLADPFVGLEAWTTYNRKMLDFFRRHKSRCVLADIYGLTRDVDGFAGRVGDQLGLNLQSHELGRLFADGELHRISGAAACDAILHRIAPEAWELYEALVAEAGIVAQVAEPAEPPPGIERLLALAEACIADVTMRAATAGSVLGLLLALLDPPLASPERARQPLVEHLRGQTRRLSELQGELDERTEFMFEVEQQRDRKGERLLALQDEFDERTLWALRLVNQVEEVKADNSELAREIGAKKQRIRELEEQLGSQEDRFLELQIGQAAKLARLSLLEARIAEQD